MDGLECRIVPLIGDAALRRLAKKVKFIICLMNLIL